MTQYKWAHWDPSREHPMGLLLGAPVERFERILAYFVAAYGEPSRITQNDPTHRPA